MSDPKLSIIIPAFNPGEFLREAVQTLLADPIPKEILVVDDGSTPREFPRVDDLPITVIRNGKNLGPAAAQNVGMRRARGEFVSFMDQDDLAVPGCFSWRVRWLEDHPAEKLVMGSLAGILDHRNKTRKSYRKLLKRRMMDMPDRLSRDYFQKGGWVPLSPLALCLFRRDFLLRVGDLDESLRRAHDREYLYRILAETEIPVVEKSVLFYRLHDKNLSVSIEDGRVVPNKRTIAELFLICKAYGIPFPT